MNTDTLLDSTELLRYNRHFPIIGQTGQQQLKASAILCIGAGGLGTPVLQYLAASGIGTIGIVDGDFVELSNLQRQVLFNVKDIGQAKVLCAQQWIHAFNPSIQVKTYPVFLSSHNAQSIMQTYDIIIDCTDNYPTRYLINDICVALQKPLVSASIHQFQGQCSVFNGKNAPCYRCLYEEPPADETMPNCATAGVLGVLPGLIGSIQASEAIKLVLNIGTPLYGRLLVFDLLTMTTKTYHLTKNPECPTCCYGELSTNFFTAEISPQQLVHWRNTGNPLFLLDIREPDEHRINPLGGTLIPLAQLTQRLGEIPKSIPIVTYCKTGARSRKAAKLLQQNGYTEVYSLQGGVTNLAKSVKINNGVLE